MSLTNSEMKKEFEDELRHEEVAKAGSKPTQYACLKIDTFERIKADATKEEAIGFCKYNIDKYAHRKKGCDADDIKKIKDYCDLWLWVLENK